MSDGERLIQYCNTYPDDDLAHRAYADWLEEQGDDARAEFVRLQLDRAQLWDGHPDDEDLWDRDRALVARHGTAWRAELPESARADATFSRGLLTQFELTGTELLQFDPTSRGFTILGLRLRATKKELAEIAAGGFLRGVRSLSLVEDLSTANALALAQGDQLAGLRRLSLRQRTSAETLAALLVCPALAGLETLELNAPVEGLAEILARPEVPFRLRRLAVLMTGEPVDLRVLTKAASCADLEELRVMSLIVMGRGKTRAGPPAFPRMRHLDLSGSRSSIGPMIRRLRLLGRCRPERLNFSYSMIQGAEIDEVLEGFDLERLTELRLSHNPLGELGWIALCATPLPSLRFLRLEHTGMTAVGLEALAHAPWLAGLRQLGLEGDSGGTAEAFRRLLHSRAVKSLEVFTANQMELGADVARVIASSPSLGSLRSLSLGQNKLGLEGARAIASSPHLRSLRRLDLSWNDVGVGGGEALLASPLTDHLVRLDLTSNNLGPELRSQFRGRAGTRPWQI